MSLWELFRGGARSSSHSIDSNFANQEGGAPDYLRAGLEWCRTMSGARRVLLWLVDERAGLVRPVGVAGGATPAGHVLHGSPITWLARERMSMRLDPAPVWAETMRAIGVPVLEERPLHVLTLELDDDLEVQPQQFDALGIYMGALLNVMHDHDILARREARTDDLLLALRELPSATTVAELGRDLVAAAIRLTDGNGAALSSWDGEVGELLFSEGGGPPPGAQFSGSDSLSAMAARGAATITRDGAALRNVRLIAERERFAITPASAAAVPLQSQGVVTGVLTVWSTGRFAEAALTALDTIAPHASRQLEHAHALGQMRVQAERDALTGLYNRRAFDHQLAAESARFERYRRPFALIIMDIDHFKQVNDSHGHDAGDVVIKGVAEIIANSLRDVDIAARYGGEEFALLLPETDKSHAIDIAERIRKRIEGAHFNWQGIAIPVTSSAGVAAMPERQQEVADLVRAADQLLYEAKRGGRNRVAHH